MGREINPFIIPFPVTIVTDEAEFAECVKSLGAEPPSIEGDAITVASGTRASSCGSIKGSSSERWSGPPRTKPRMPRSICSP